MDEKKQTGWFVRNWKWFVPTGCLTGIIVFTLFIGLIYWGVTSIIRNSEAYKRPMQLVNNNEEVVSLLGSPIESTFLIQGNINISGSSGNADLSIPVRGPEAKGVLYVIAVKRAGRWNFELLEIKINGRSERISLIE